MTIDEHLAQFADDRAAAGHNVVGGKPKGSMSFFHHAHHAGRLVRVHLAVATERVLEDRDAVAYME